MPRVCEYTGKRNSTGHAYRLRGKAKYLGGVGTKVTSKVKRVFRPNIQTVSVVDENGSVRRVKASTKAFKMGLIVKPLKRKYAYKRDQVAAA